LTLLTGGNRGLGEVSRFACSSPEWQQLVAVSRRAPSLIDREMAYAPRLSSGWLLRTKRRQAVANGLLAVPIGHIKM